MGNYFPNLLNASKFCPPRPPIPAEGPPWRNPWPPANRIFQITHDKNRRPLSDIRTAAEMTRFRLL